MNCTSNATGSLSVCGSMARTTSPASPCIASPFSTGHCVSTNGGADVAAPVRGCSCSPFCPGSSCRLSCFGSSCGGSAFSGLTCSCGLVNHGNSTPSICAASAHVSTCASSAVISSSTSL